MTTVEGLFLPSPPVRISRVSWPVESLAYASLVWVAMWDHAGPPQTLLVGMRLFELAKQFRHVGINRLALKSGIDGHPDSPQVGHSRPASTALRLNLFYVAASSDQDMQYMRHLSRHITLNNDYFGYSRFQKYLPRF